jgi:hypothetical protein
MTALRFATILLATSFTLVAERVPAQARTSAAVDATVGIGVGKGGEYIDRAIAGGRLAASLRRWQTPHTGVFGELSMDWLAVSMGHDLVCGPSPRGGCVTPYPELSGPAATVGVVTGRTDGRFEARLGAGGGAYGADGTRVGAVVSQLDASVFPVSHVGLIAGARWIVVPRYRSDKLSMVTCAFGLRLR